MNSPAHDIALWLAAKPGFGGMGGLTDWCLNVAQEPAQPINAITIYDVPGGEPDTDEMDIFTPSFQIRARAMNFEEGYSKLEAIQTLLTQSFPFEAETSRFNLVVSTSDIAYLGRNENNHYLLTSNYRSRRVRKEA